MSSPARRLEPPSGGTPPPDTIRLRGGEPLFLAPLAHEAARRHHAEFPDEHERYGDAGLEWCVHDLQYVLAWAGLDDAEPGLLGERLRWLADLLAARGYDTRRLGRSLELLADVVSESRPGAAGIAHRLRDAAAGLSGGGGGERQRP